MVKALSSQDLTDDRLIFLFVSSLEPHLGVLDDAAGVQNVCRSTVGVLPAQIGIVAVENGISDSQLLRCFPGLLRVRKHRDREDQKTILGITLMEFLEMDHLLT